MCSQVYAVYKHVTLNIILQNYWEIIMEYFVCAAYIIILLQVLGSHQKVSYGCLIPIKVDKGSQSGSCPISSNKTQMVSLLLIWLFCSIEIKYHILIYKYTFYEIFAYFIHVKLQGLNTKFRINILLSKGFSKPSSSFRRF